MSGLNDIPITVVDTYGDTKNRDVYSRNTFSAITSGGASASIIHEFFGVNTSDVAYAMAQLTATETGIENAGEGVFTIGTTNGTTVSDVLSLSQTTSTLTTGTLSVSGDVSTATIVQNDLDADAAQIQLVEDVTVNSGNAAINFVVGDLDGINSTPLIVSYDGTAAGGTVDVSGALLINGVDVESLITGGNPWDGADPGTPIADLKDTYDQVRIGINDGYATIDHNTTVALDINGTMHLRGNDLLMFDQNTLTHYSVLNYDEANSNVLLRTSRASDNLVLQTALAADDTWSQRLSIAGGAGTTTATFENVLVGIGAVATTNALEVTGDMSLTGGITTGATGGDIDVSANSLLNVSTIVSEDSQDEEATITLTSSATAGSPQIDLGVAAVTAVTVTETLTTITNPAQFDSTVTITGDLTVNGTTTTINATEVVIDDINIVLASGTDTSADLDGAGITLGDGTFTATMNYSDTLGTWDLSTGLGIATDTAITIPNSAGASNSTVLDANLTLATAAPFIYLGAANEWRIGISNDGSFDHFEIAHDDLSNGTYVVKLDVQE